MLEDLRFAFRQLVKNPGFTLIAIFALALGIGANSAIFSVVNAVLLRPLPYPNSEQLVAVSQTVRSTGVSTHDASPANFLDWAEENNAFSALAAGRGWQANLGGNGEPQRIRAAMVSSRFFSLFAINPMLGRYFGTDDIRSGNAHVAVLGYNLWARNYGAQPDVIGRDLILDGDKFEVIGVMPPNFSPDNYGELWVPSGFDVPTHPLTPNANPRQYRDRSYLDVWGRLKAGVPLARARAEMSAIAQRLEQKYPDANLDVGAEVVPLHEQLVGNIRPMLLMLLGAVCLVLLISCANVANLLLARATTRSREMAVRTALGASRSQLVRQLLSESTLLALLGGAVGLALSMWTLPLLLSLSPQSMTEFSEIGLNARVLGFTLLVSLANGVLFGLAPALFASRSNPNDALHQGERSSSLNRNAGRASLIAGEIAMSVVLLVGAALLIKSFARVTHVDPGFKPDSLLVFNIARPGSGDSVKDRNFYQQVIDRLAGIPGVKSVAAVNRLPLTGGNSSRSFSILGTTQTYSADLRVSTMNYFSTMGIPLLRGRNFSEHDTATSTPVAIINKAAADIVFADKDPIGELILNFGPENATLQIVGVIGNVRHVALEAAARPEIYVPFTQTSWPSMYVAMRSNTPDPVKLLPSVQSRVWSVDPTVALANPRTMQDLMAQSVVSRRFFMLLLAIFAGFATLLAAMGLYGVIAFWVAQRTKEIGIRMALGGQRGDVLSLVLRRSATVVSIGALVGIPAAFAASQLLSRLLYGVRVSDFATYALVIAVLGAAAFLASIVPAIRATRVDPIIALRTE